MLQTPPVKVFGEHSDSGTSLVEAAVSGYFPKYTRLDEAAFAHFSHLRDGFSLHFHLASHDRCEVKLKPKLWDSGAYFLPELLDDGALHVVPHFTQKHQRTQISQKRAATPLEPADRVIVRPEPRSRRPTDMEKDDRTLAVEHPTKRYQDLRLDCNQHIQNSKINISRKVYPGLKIENSNREDTTWKYANCVAHKLLMEGEYGVQAQTRCTNCEQSGLICRVYHSRCYNWAIEGRSAQTELGWRCSNCRLKKICIFPDGENSSTLEADKYPTSGCKPLQNDTIAAPGSSVDLQGRNQFSSQLQNNPSARLRRIPPLPASLTRDTWAADFEAAKQRYFNSYTSADMELRRHKQNSNAVAHQELVRGKCGVHAMMACDNCSDRERECRTYHPDCYRWKFPEAFEAVEYLGWRCADCRFEGYDTGGCNVQWE